MNSKEKQILNLILANEIAMSSNDLLSEASEIINTYEMSPSQMKKAQMQSLINITMNTLDIGSVTNFINHQTSRLTESWGKKVNNKSFGKTVNDKIKEIINQSQGHFEIAQEKLQEVLSSQRQLRETITAQEKKETLHQIKIKLLRKFIQHLFGAYEAAGAQ